MTKAIYAGSFDILTDGHLWVIETAAKLFESLHIAVGTNKSKTPMFETAARVQIIEKDTQHLNNVEVSSFHDEYLVNYATGINAKYIVRGIRNIQDFEYEKTLQNLNFEINPAISTIMLCPPKRLSEISSSVVKSLMGPKGWKNVVIKMVPPASFKALILRDVK